MNTDEYLELIEKYPNLTSEGFGVNMDNANGLSRQAYFSQEREDLKGQLARFELCVEWLEDYPICEGWNAHYWKDQVQFYYKPDHPGYFHIPRGAFILAALYRGIPVTKMHGSTDAWIGGSE